VFDAYVLKGALNTSSRFSSPLYFYLLKYDEMVVVIVVDMSFISSKNMCREPRKNIMYHILQFCLHFCFVVMVMFFWNFDVKESIVHNITSAL
jgi:hypothetical protein